jgi:hypothetical protein
MLVQLCVSHVRVLATLKVPSYFKNNFPIRSIIMTAMITFDREQEFAFSRLYLMRLFWCASLFASMFKFKHLNTSYCALYTGLQSNELHITRLQFTQGDTMLLF